MFASQTLTEHVARGLAGIGMLLLAIFSASSRPWLALIAVPAALLLLRGCPTCWTLGLLETLQARRPRRSSPESPSLWFTRNACPIRSRRR